MDKNKYILFPNVKVVIEWERWEKCRMTDHKEYVGKSQFALHIDKEKLVEEFLNEESFNVNYLPNEYLEKFSKEELIVLGEFPHLFEDYIKVTHRTTMMYIDDLIEDLKLLDTGYLIKIMNEEVPVSEKLRGGMSYCNLTSMIDKVEKIKENNTKGNIQFSEKQIERILSRNIHLIEEGMSVVGTQVRVDDGYIDILARDMEGILCIIEIKVVDNCEKLVFQSGYYPSQFDEKVRMITVCPNYKPKIRKALASLNTNVELKTFEYKNNELSVYGVDDFSFKAAI
ncbi:endonuclease NucS domain-containing protein [Brevibacillus sp. NRS-1366]|uniref:endonuclease NucS domain-containing protein n=1 Tax=Brevibacillus sp. NRS-1366 TaxID=3233899 RepID=UPI003D1B3EE9